MFTLLAFSWNILKIYRKSLAAIAITVNMKSCHRIDFNRQFDKDLTYVWESSVAPDESISTRDATAVVTRLITVQPPPLDAW